MILLQDLISLYIYVFVFAAILSWFPSSTSQGGLAQIKRVVIQLTEPVLRPIRQVMPRTAFGGVAIDFSVWVAIIGLEIIRYFL